MALDAAGDVFIADTTNNQIREIWVANSSNSWIANKGGNSVTELSNSGAVLAGSPYNGTFSAPSALALDAGGNLWVAQSGNSSLLYLTPSSGVSVAAGTGGLSQPASVAIDPWGQCLGRRCRSQCCHRGEQQWNFRERQRL